MPGSLRVATNAIHSAALAGNGLPWATGDAFGSTGVLDTTAAVETARVGDAGGAASMRDSLARGIAACATGAARACLRSGGDDPARGALWISLFATDEAPGSNANSRRSVIEKPIA